MVFMRDYFWLNHDPRQLNKQGPDIGNQYRSAIFFNSKQQKQTAEKSSKAQQNKINGKIVTEIVPLKIFYKAEEYHQNYLSKKGISSCKI
jgi:peptide-methionine (S)-S-oxide reductase